MTDWNKRFLELAHHVAGWSKDPSTKTGAVIAIGRHDISCGYNGFPRGVEDTEQRLTNRDLRYKFTVHAEANAILNALMQMTPIVGATMYMTLFPCSECAKLIIQAGIRELVITETGRPKNPDGRPWGWDQSATEIMFEEAGVHIRWEDR